MRFASHRDIARAVERGVRRAGLPVAYSAGFSPHPKISYAGGAPTGTASEAEYLEISLTRACAAADVRHQLDAALPDGIDVIEVRELSDRPGGGSALRLEESQWRAVLPGVSPGEAARAVEAFLATPSVMVERLTSKGLRRLDARAAVVDLALDRRAAEAENGDRAILRMVVRHLTPSVRPDDILAALGAGMQSAGSMPAGAVSAGTAGAAATATAGTATAVTSTADSVTSGAKALKLSSPPLVTRLSQGPAAQSPGASSGIPGQAAAEEQEKATRQDKVAAEATGTPLRAAGGTAPRAAGSSAPRAADAAMTGAYEQLPRGADEPGSGSRAREDDGRLPGCSTPSDMTQDQDTMSRLTVAPLA
jgi:radical SAM-linked protein